MDGNFVKIAAGISVDVLKYITETEDPVEQLPQTEMAGQIVRKAVKAPELKDELYMQLMKQSRDNPTVQSRVRVWELWLVLAATAPPSKVKLRFMESARCISV